MIDYRDYVIAIPSADRDHVINNKTLFFLRQHDIPMENVYVFVPERCYENYRKKFYVYKELNLIVGKEGIRAQRKAISDYFKEGQFIICLDDDVASIDILHYLPKTGKPTLKRIDNLERLIAEVKERLIESKLSMCGFYPCDNAFFMKKTITNDLSFCIGAFRMFFNRRACENREFVLLEDYETSIKYFLRDNGILRYNYITLKHSYNAEKWNLTLDDKKFEIKSFMNKYPKYCFTKTKKTSLDIQFKKKVPNDILTTLWIGKELNELVKLSINSWLSHGYNVRLYIGGGINRDNLPKEWFERVELRYATDIMEFEDINDMLPFSDIWRFNLLIKNPSTTWIDADMVLLDRLPNEDIIISSEHTFKSGAYKSKSDNKPNIGVLRFGKDNDILKDILKSCKNYSDYKFTDIMKKFQDKLKSTKYKYLNKYIVNQNVFCPIPWWCASESYYSNKFSKKYAVDVFSVNDVITRCTGVHLWNNFTYNKHNIDFDLIDKRSLYYKLDQFYNKNKIEMNSDLNTKSNNCIENE